MPRRQGDLIISFPWANSNLLLFISRLAKSVRGASRILNPLDSLEMYKTNHEMMKSCKTPQHLDTHSSQETGHEPEKKAAAAKQPPPPFQVDISAADVFGCVDA